MSSIKFFTPVTYDKQIKTISQQALEIVDEYFYFGNRFHVSIFAADAEHPQFWAMQNHRNRHRSWTNIAIKINSYCTLTLPLIALLAKVMLRSYLQVSSIQVQQQFVSDNHIEDRLPIDVLENVISFLSYQDRRQLAQVAIFARDAVRDTQQHYINLMNPLKTEIETLPARPLAHEDFQRLLVGLVTSPAAGHPKQVPVMDALMEHLASENTVNGIIQKHANMADLLANSAQPISPNQIYQFCKYLERKQLSQYMPWIGYRVLEQYLLKPQLNFAIVHKALKEYLTQQAKVHIRVARNVCLDPTIFHTLSRDHLSLKYQVIDIDPRTWFGLNGENRSLWRQPGAQNDEIAPIPELLLEVLETRIHSLRVSSGMNQCFMVDLLQRTEALLARNFTRTLALHILNANLSAVTIVRTSNNDEFLVNSQSVYY